MSAYGLSMAKSDFVPPMDLIIRRTGFDVEFPGELMGDMPEAFRKNKYSALYDIGFKPAESWFTPSMKYIHSLAAEFLKALVHTPDLENLRGDAVPDWEAVDIQKLVSKVPFAVGSDFVTKEWIMGLWERLLQSFSKDIKNFDGTVDHYISLRSQDLHVPGRIFFHMVEYPSGDYPFAFIATYSPESGGAHVPLKFALEEYSGDDRKMLELLSGLNGAAEKSELIASFMDTGELFHPLGMSPFEAYTFLTEVPIYEECGILCRIPNWWKHRASSLSMSLVMGADESPLLGLSTLLTINPEFVLDGEKITEDEVRALMDETAGLAFLKGRWVEVDKERLAKLLEAVESVRGSGSISMSEALGMAAGICAMPGEADLGIQVSNGEWLSRLLDNLRPAATDEVKIPKSFKGKLRPYQKEGVSWLHGISSMGFGACLADDMGLGKTVQVLAFLEQIRAKHPDQHHLMVVPASLIGNWEREASKFVPDMSVGVLHGLARKLPDTFLTITTYGMAVRVEALSEKQWDSITLDEAQAIKNPNTKQTRAVKKLKAGFKLALTGTPVENKLMDLWSIYDFINPGLLGTLAEFRDYAYCIGDSDDGYARLRGTISPFMLRRLKTDSTIISDLPEKNEIKDYVTMSRRQTVLYNLYTDELEEALQESEGLQRRGLVLSALTKYKQICNHPDQYLGQDAFAEADSGKFEMLTQICETVRDNRERIIVFTQYREMTEPLADAMTKVFGRPGLILHGGTSPEERTEMVDAFNGEEYIPFMVLSLKAGGVGLNLTAANHVIHFDRWWNPAVEDQATDRAYRIGQRKDVIVHKFVCRGTVEEKIDDMIETKTGLAGEVVAGGGSWITEMNDKQLMDLFRLG